MKTAREIMVVEPKFCFKSDTINDVMQLMAATAVTVFPVVDANKKLCGLITSGDICKYIGSGPNDNLASNDVDEIINNKQVYVCGATDSIHSILKIMRTYKVKLLPVIDTNKNLLGIISLNHILLIAMGSEAAAKEISSVGDENVVKTLHSIASA